LTVLVEHFYKGCETLLLTEASKRTNYKREGCWLQPEDGVRWV